MEHTSDKAGSAERVETKLVMNSIAQDASQEDIADKSPFSATEMWMFVPALVRDEVLNHLDLRQATRLARVSSSWAEAIKKIIKRSNGIAFLENWSTVIKEGSRRRSF